MNITENKAYWVLEGAELEKLFISQYGDQLGLMVNPSKGKNKFLPDLMDWYRCRFAELKTQQTKFNSSGSLYGIDPRYAFTFDEYTAYRYAFRYPDIDIYLWLKYDQEKVSEIYRVPFKRLHQILLQSSLHIQSRRAELNTLNKAVFVFDVRQAGITKVM